MRGLGSIGCVRERPAKIFRQPACLTHCGTEGCVVIEPEIEAWLWGMTEGMRAIPKLQDINAADWLRSQHAGPEKPRDPKHLLKELFYHHGNAKWEPSNFRRVAEKAPLDDEACRCRSYRRFVSILRTWFPLSAS